MFAVWNIPPAPRSNGKQNIQFQNKIDWQYCWGVHGYPLVFNFPTFYTADFPLHIAARQILGRGAGSLPFILSINASVFKQRNWCYVILCTVQCLHCRRLFGQWRFPVTVRKRCVNLCRCESLLIQYVGTQKCQVPEAPKNPNVFCQVGVIWFVNVH